MASKRAPEKLGLFHPFRGVPGPPYLSTVSDVGAGKRSAGKVLGPNMPTRDSKVLGDVGEKEKKGMVRLWEGEGGKMSSRKVSAV